MPRLCFATVLAFSLVAASAPAQTVPVTRNLWRLVAQEDTVGDQKITVHDRVTPFALQDANGATVLVVSNVYPLSVLLRCGRSPGALVGPGVVP